MTVEAATWITDLQPANPPSTDPRGQGDDHLRLIKQVLQDTFPTSSKAWYNPTAQSKSADFVVAATDMNKTFLVDTTGGLVNMTLPTLVSGDAGWECFLLKTNTGANPVLVKPPSGTLSSGEYAGLAAARRCIPGRRIQCLWSGTGWLVARANTLPVTALISCQGSGLAVGYEYPNGQTLANVATNYPELNSVLGSGVLIDLRGRAEYVLDNLGGSSAGNITTNTFSSVTAIGGVCTSTDRQTLITGNLPPYTPAGSVVLGALGGNTAFVVLTPGSNVGIGGTATGGQLETLAAALSGNPWAFTGTAQGGTSIPFSRIGPAIIVNKIMVVE